MDPSSINPICTLSGDVIHHSRPVAAESMSNTDTLASSSYADVVAGLFPSQSASEASTLVPPLTRSTLADSDSDSDSDDSDSDDSSDLSDTDTEVEEVTNKKKHRGKKGRGKKGKGKKGRGRGRGRGRVRGRGRKSRKIRTNFNRRSARKDCVKTLMEELPPLKKIVNGVEKPHLRYSCKKCKFVCTFQQGVGWTNPCSHLNACYKCDDIVEKKERIEEMDLDFEKVMMGSANKDVHHLHNYIKMVVEKNLPVTMCENETFRKMTEGLPNLSYRKVRQIILRIKLILKLKLAKRLRMTERGGIMFDSWTRYNVHYCGIIANVVGPEGEVESHLMSCFPLTNGKVRVTRNQGDHSQVMLQRDGIDVIESHRFTAESYATSINHVFEDYEIDIGEWLTHLVSDNASTMRRTALLMNIPFIGCRNHLMDLVLSSALPLDLTKDQIEEHINAELLKTLYSCQETMKAAKIQAKAGALLRARVALKPHIAVRNRWLSKPTMMD